jgi:hypothetical protein
MRSIAAQQMSNGDIQAYNVASTGLARFIAQMENVGTVPGKDQIDNIHETLTLKPGDTVATKMRKLAEARQQVELNAKSMLASPDMATEQKELLQSNIEKIKKAVPYTMEDIQRLDDAGRTSPKTTLADLYKQGTDKAAPVSLKYDDAEKEARYQQWLKDHPQ